MVHKTTPRRLVHASMRSCEKADSLVLPWVISCVFHNAGISIVTKRDYVGMDSIDVWRRGVHYVGANVSQLAFCAIHSHSAHVPWKW